MGYNDIYRDNQEKYEDSNRLIFKQFLDQFKEMTKLNMDNLMHLYQVDTSDPAKEFYFLRWALFNYCHRCIPYFYELLEDMGYDMYSEIMDTMNLIGKDTYSIVDPETVAYALISPYINGITTHKDKPGMVTIHSDDLGDYSFYPLRIYLKENKSALNIINKYEKARFCHQMSWEMMNHFDKCQLITSLLPSYFEGTHYHTVAKDDAGFIVDCAMEAVYTEEMRDYLFKPKDICVTDKSDLDGKLKEAMENEDEESKLIDFPPAMLLTLHEQSKALG